MTTELVKSVSIENLVNQRCAVLERIESAVKMLRDASEIASTANLGMPRFTVSTGYGRRGDGIEVNTAFVCPDRAGATMRSGSAELDAVMKAIKKGIDATGWQYLMHESGMRSLMDATARQKWDGAVHEGDIPELTAPNIRSTFTMLHDSRGEIFERGVIECFRSLSWHYKTNQPQKFGKRIVLTYLRNSVTGGKWGGASSLGYPNNRSCDKLDDLSRVFSVLDGKPEPDHRAGWYGRVSNCARLSDPMPADDYMSIKRFRNGNGHATFLRLDLVDKMNKIIAKHYPGALPAPK